MANENLSIHCRCLRKGAVSDVWLEKHYGYFSMERASQSAMDWIAHYKGRFWSILEWTAVALRFAAKARLQPM
jgi:hypothetical protein